MANYVREHGVPCLSSPKSVFLLVSNSIYPSFPRTILTLSVGCLHAVTATDVEAGSLTRSVRCVVRKFESPWGVTLDESESRALVGEADAKRGSY